MTPEYLKEFLHTNGILPKHYLGQNFLLDEILMQDIITAAGITPADNVLEVGPGIASFTRFLCDSAQAVFAVEKDATMQPLLQKVKKERKNFDFVLTDVLDLDFKNVPLKHPFKIVANLPYYISGVFMRKLISQRTAVHSATLLLQKEVAENITAPAGKMNLLALNCQLHAEAKYLITVPAEKFYPVPKVSSAVVQLIFKSKENFAFERELFQLAKAAFSGKRKQIHNTLTQSTGMNAAEVASLLQTVNITPQTRPQTLSLEQWKALARGFNQIKQK